MTERKPKGLRRWPVLMPHLLADQIDLLVEAGYFVDRSSFMREAAAKYAEPKMQQLIFESGGMEVFKDIGNRKKLREGPGRIGSPGRAGSAGALSSEDLT
jgi:hypothetical protein